MVLCHRRPYLLELIVKQLSKYWPNQSVVHFAMDRPTPAVELEVERLVMSTQSVKCRAYYLPFPVVSSQGERYMEARNFQLEALHQDEPRYVAFWDDDFFLEHPAEAVMLVRGNFYDMVYAHKLYLWDSPTQFTTHLPEHNSVFLFRRRLGDKFPLDRMIQAPLPLHDDPEALVMQMNSRLIDIGYMHEAERQYIFKQYAKAGKIDQLTKGLLDPPRLHKTKYPKLVQALNEYKSRESAVH